MAISFCRLGANGTAFSLAVGAWGGEDLQRSVLVLGHGKKISDAFN